MLADPAVPRRAVTGTLWSRVRLDSVLLIPLAFLPMIGHLKNFAARRDDLLIRRQRYVINETSSMVMRRQILNRPSSGSSAAIVNLKPEDIGGDGNDMVTWYEMRHK